MSREKTGKDNANRKQNLQNYGASINLKMTYCISQGYVVKKMTIVDFPKRSNGRFGFNKIG